jgi:hypothetical protein
MPKLVLNKAVAEQLQGLWAANGAVELVDENGRDLGTAWPKAEYRPLPPYGTPEFEAEIERRHRNPGRTYTIEESLKDWDTI